jgi:hypothetical protein
MATMAAATSTSSLSTAAAAAATATPTTGRLDPALESKHVKRLIPKAKARSAIGQRDLITYSQMSPGVWSTIARPDRIHKGAVATDKATIVSKSREDNDMNPAGGGGDIVIVESLQRSGVSAAAAASKRQDHDVVVVAAAAAPAVDTKIRGPSRTAGRLQGNVFSPAFVRFTFHIVYFFFFFQKKRRCRVVSTDSTVDARTIGS